MYVIMNIELITERFHFVFDQHSQPLTNTLEVSEIGSFVMLSLKTKKIVA